MLIIVMALITTVVLRGQLSLFWQRSTVLVVGAFLHSLQMLAAEMGMRSESPYRVWVTELYRLSLLL